MKRESDTMKDPEHTATITRSFVHDAEPQQQQEQSLDASLSNSLTKLALHDRTAITEELHGVHCLALTSSEEESKAIVLQSLHDFDRELLETIQQKRRSKKENTSSNSSNNEERDVLRNVRSIAALLVTTAENGHHGGGCYVNDPRVRLRFLRTELFHITKAVKRFIAYLEFLQELFGPWIADRLPTVHDFSGPGELAALKHSSIQFLPYRDRSGRRVHVSLVNHRKNNLDDTLTFKIITYLNWITSDSIETQQKGVISIIWFYDGHTHDHTQQHTHTTNIHTNGGNEDDGYHRSILESSKPKALFVRYLKLHEQSVPLRLVGFHFCAQDTPVARMLAMAMFLTTSTDQIRARFKFHFGSSTEIRYGLQSYGILTDTIPLTHTGSLKTVNQTQWVNGRAALESTPPRRHGNTQYEPQTNTSVRPHVDCPGSKDVIFRKGRRACLGHTCTGNTYYRHLVERWVQQHLRLEVAAKLSHALSGPRLDVSAMTTSIITAIQQPPRSGHFLEWDMANHAWYILTDRAKLRIKVHSLYKLMRYDALKKQKHQHPQPPPPPPGPRGLVEEHQQQKRHKTSRISSPSSSNTNDEDGIRSSVLSSRLPISYNYSCYKNWFGGTPAGAPLPATFGATSTTTTTYTSAVNHPNTANVAAQIEGDEESTILPKDWI